MKQNILARVTVRRTTIHLRPNVRPSNAYYRIEEIIGRSDLPVQGDNQPNALVGDIIRQEDVDHLVKVWDDHISTRVLAPKE